MKRDGQGGRGAGYKPFAPALVKLAQSVLLRDSCYCCMAAGCSGRKVFFKESAACCVRVGFAKHSDAQPALQLESRQTGSKGFPRQQSFEETLRDRFAEVRASKPDGRENTLAILQSHNKQLIP